LALLAAGCQRLNFDETFTVDAQGAVARGFTAPRYAQKVTVTVTPTGGPVSAYLVKDPDGKYVDTLNAHNKPPADEVIGSKESLDKAETYSFEANVPAKTAYTLVVYAEKGKAEVRVQVVGR
jgi:hypothetical protein